MMVTPNMRVQRTRRWLGQSTRFVVVAVGSALTIFAQEPTPAVPPGFQWHPIPEIKVKLLVPDGWHFNREKGAPSAYLVTLEDYAKTGRYDTGASLTVTHLTKDHDVLSVAEQRIRAEAQEGEVVQPVSVDEFGVIRGYSCVVKRTVAGRDTTFAYMATANPRTGALYTITFQSPSAMWPGTWERGRWIVGRIKLDDEF